MRLIMVQKCVVVLVYAKKAATMSVNIATVAVFLGVQRFSIHFCVENH